MAAEYIAYALKENLGITVTIEALPFAQQLELFFTGKSKFWRSGWLIDYPDPRPFLELAYGKNIPAGTDEPSSINSTRFKNAEFDLAFEKAAIEPDEKMRMNYYRQAESIAMQNAFLMPLYYEITDEIVASQFQNYSINPLGTHDFSEVWIQKK
jgi:peptide/nickel transport system substrate-binding protein